MIIIKQNQESDLILLALLYELYQYRECVLISFKEAKCLRIIKTRLGIVILKEGYR